MNRDKILEKSRKENLLGDERDTKQRMLGVQYSLTFGCLAFIVLFLLSKTRFIEINSAKVMMSAMLTGHFLSNLLLKKSESPTWKNGLKLLVVISSAFLTLAYIWDMMV